MEQEGGREEGKSRRGEKGKGGAGGRERGREELEGGRGSDCEVLACSESHWLFAKVKACRHWYIVVELSAPRQGVGFNVNPWCTLTNSNYSSYVRRYITYHIVAMVLI